MGWNSGLSTVLSFSTDLWTHEQTRVLNFALRPEHGKSMSLVGQSTEKVEVKRCLNGVDSTPESGMHAHTNGVVIPRNQAIDSSSSLVSAENSSSHRSPPRSCILLYSPLSWQHEKTELRNPGLLTVFPSAGIYGRMRKHGF